MTAPYEVREAARGAYINHEGYGRVEGFNAAADLAYAAGLAAGRKQAAADIRAEAKRVEEQDGQGYSYAYGFADAAEFLDPSRSEYAERPGYRDEWRP